MTAMPKKPRGLLGPSRPSSTEGVFRPDDVRAGEQGDPAHFRRRSEASAPRATGRYQEEIPVGRGRPGPGVLFAGLPTRLELFRRTATRVDRS